MENLLIEMLIPPEIKAGLKLGEQILNGGMIVDSQTNSAMYINEGALEEILSQKLFPIEETLSQNLSPMALGIPQAAAAVTLAVAVGFLAMNSKLNKIQEQLQDIKSDLTEIKKIVSDTQEYEIGKLFADVKSCLKESELNIVENKPENLIPLRREFLKIKDRVDVLINMIKNKDKIISLRNTFMQYLQLYHTCFESAIHCSMAGKEYDAAKTLILDSAKKFNDLKELYRQTFINAPASQIANVAYEEIESLRQNYFKINLMEQCVKTNKKLLRHIKRGKFTYVEFENKMRELQTIKEPAVLLIR